MAKWQWSQTFAANATADPNINWAEGMSPSSVNDSARAMMGVDAQDYADNNGTLVTTGSSTAYLVTTNQGFGSTPQAGMRLSISPHVTNGTPATIAVDGIPAKPLRSAPGVELGGAALSQGTPYRITYFSSNGGEWVCTGAPLAATVNVPFINVVAFGAKGDGTTDNTAAFTAAVAAMKALPAGGCLYAPAGKYHFGSQQTVTYPSNNVFFDCTIIGDGQDATVLHWTSGNGMQVIFNSAISNERQSFHCRDLSFQTAGQNSGNALILTQGGTNVGSASALSELTRVSFLGDDAPDGVNYWANDLVITGISNVNIDGCGCFGPASIAGGGISFAGQNSSNIATVLNMKGTTINFKAIGFRYGDFIQGVTITGGCNITNCTVGVAVPAGLSGVDGQLVISDSQLAIVTSNAACISIGSPVSGVQIDNNTIVMGSPNVVGQVAIDFAQTGNFAITNNIILTSNHSPNPSLPNQGIVIGTSVGATAGYIDGNTYGNLDIAENFAGGTSNIRIGQRNFINCTTNTTNAGTNNNANFAIPTPSGQFAVQIENTAGISGAHGLVISSGLNATSDSGTVVASFGTGNSSAVVGSITRNGTGVAFNQTSDLRRKHRICTSTRGLETLRQLRVVDFALRDDPDGRLMQGLIAQWCLKHYPEAIVRGGRDPNKQPWQLDYGRFSPLLMLSTQQLADIVDEQNDTIKELKRRMDKLERGRVR